MNRKKILLYSILSILICGFLYLYLWEKPRYEAIWKKMGLAYLKTMDLPAEIDVEKFKISIIPLQFELYNTHLKLEKYEGIEVAPFKIKKAILRPSLLDLVLGKFWASLVAVEGAKLDIKMPLPKGDSKTPNTPIDLKLDTLLPGARFSQARIQDIQLSLNVGNKYFVKTEALYMKAYNEKSSLIITIKDPNLGIKTQSEGEYLHFLTDLQLMATKNTISLSKIKVVKDDSFFLASGNVLYNKDPRNFDELHIKTRLSSNFSDLDTWSNIIKKNQALKKIKGSFKFDLEFNKIKSNKAIATDINGSFNQLKVGKVMIGGFDINANIPDIQATKNGPEQINISKIDVNLAGNNKAQITDAKIHLGENTEIKADLEVKNAQLHSFLRDSGIADIPVWLQVGGRVKCAGGYNKTLNIDCPGALTIKNLKVKTASRSKMIVAAKKIDIAGSIKITEKNISYKAKAKMKKTHGESDGVIDYDKGFDINYKSDFLDLSEIGPIGELKFLGTGKTQGSTQGNSDYAVFGMDIETTNFEFENYFFGDLKSKMNYKAGSLYFNKIDGNLESTRFNGKLQVNLIKDKIIGDIQLPFFRMTDIQQAVLKKVDLKDRFLGSGSGRIILDTPFEISQLNFNLDARLFKGNAFGEEYNEAKIKAQSVDGIIIIQEGVLQKEKTQFLMKGTIDTDLKSQLSFVINNGFLQLSSRLKEYNLPISGEFSANGEIFGQLGSPFIKTKAEIKNLIFNKKKYGNGLFSYDNSNKQTNLQFNIPKKLELLLLLPEGNYDSIFIDANSNKLDIAPILGFVVSEDATRSYVIETSGEISGTFNTQTPWNSEFSSTIKDVTFDYKSNKMKTTIPTNIELKNGKLFLNEISFIGNKQHIKVTQPYTEKYRTKFIINSRMNIAFFKLFAPFIEKVDGYSTLRLELSLNNKDVKLIGSSYTTDSFLKFPGFPHAFENLSADVLFNQNKVLINSLSGELAGGKVLGNGEVKFMGAKKFDIFINTSMENVNIHFPDGFKTSGSGNISLSGSQAPFLLSGQYDVNEGLIDNNFDSGSAGDSSNLLEELLKKEITSPLVINLDINTKKPVEVRNKLVEGYILGNIKVFDKIDAPRIKGSARFDENAVIRFQDQEFEVTSSSFNFEGQSPINPKLSLRANTRMNQYDIDLFLQGRAAKPILTWTSQPPLPESQIVSMLALGTLPDQFNQNNNTDPNSSGAQNFEVGTSLLSNNPLGKELKDKYDVDVQFSSSYDDQNNAAVPKVTVRHKVTRDFQISVSATSGNTNQQDGRATYELNNDLSAIFFIQNIPEDPNNPNNLNQGQQNNRIGVDLEYRKEFD